MNDFQSQLKQFVENNPNLVSMRETSHAGLYVLKYKKRVFYDSLWNEYLEECRGTIVDKDFNVVSRPFTKVYNFGVESKAPKISLDTNVTAYRKVNGFMVAMTHYRGNLIISTTGSTDSKYVDYAKEMMLTHAPMKRWEDAAWASHGATLMFECVHPEDPHIVPEKPGMYFLGWRENKWDSKINGYGIALANAWRKFALKVLGCYYADCIHVTMAELIAESKRCQHEGFVLYTKDGISTKIKSPYYLVGKFVARNPNTDKLLRADAKEKIEEEYYPLLDYIRENIESFTALTEQERLAFVRNFLENT